MIYEFIGTLRRIKDNPMPITLWMFIVIVCLTVQCKSKKISRIDNIIMCSIAACLLPVYHFALITFLMLLMYPMKVIAVFAYLITSIFVAIIVCSIHMLAFEQFNACLKLKNIRFSTTLLFICALVYLMMVVAFSFGLIMILPLVLMLNQSSSSNAGPIVDTILSLIPSAAIIISLVSWILKTKFLQSGSVEELKNALSAEDTTEQRNTDDSNADTEEEHTLLPRSGSSQDRGRDYGATKDEDKNNEETNV